ncbi:MAG: hypothetical protein KC471_01390 [Flavobacteriaceae bacterium]|nr:hypothetical protein [Flavobacteriaceae bacterium]
MFIKKLRFLGLFLCFYFTGFSNLRVVDFIDSFRNSDHYKGMKRSFDNLAKSSSMYRSKAPIELSFMRESHPVSGSDQYLTLKKNIEFPWLTKANKEKNTVESGKYTLEFQAFEIDRIYEIKTVFYEALYLENIKTYHKEYLRELLSLAKKIKFIEDMGENDGYDLKRVNQEINLEKQYIKRFKLKIDLLLSELHILSNLNKEGYSVMGELLPDWSDKYYRKSLEKLNQNIEIRKLEKEKNLLVSQKKLLKNRPESFEVEFGNRHINEPGLSDNALVFGVSTNLPLEDRYKYEKQRLKLRLRVIDLNKREKESRLQANLSSQSNHILSLIRQEKVLKNKLIYPAKSLIKTIYHAFEGGERKLIELIDGYKHLLDSRLELNDLNKQARDIWIDYHQSLIGVKK